MNIWGWIFFFITKILWIWLINFLSHSIWKKKSIWEDQHVKIPLKLCDTQKGCLLSDNVMPQQKHPETDSCNGNWTIVCVLTLFPIPLLVLFFPPLSFLFSSCLSGMLAAFHCNSQLILAITEDIQAICTHLFEEKTRGEENTVLLSSANHSGGTSYQTMQLITRGLV